MTRRDSGRVLTWTRIAAAVVVAGAALTAWQWWPRTPGSLEEFAVALAPHRHAWYALPAVVAVFVTLGLAMVPVLLLITATGLVFGPLLGSVYAMVGSVASASIGFLIGRWVGPRRVEELGGGRARRLIRGLRRNGTLAVYLIRKVPAPFTLVNIVIGASTVRYRDFVIGTVLGMIAVVVALAGFGYQFAEALQHPSPGAFGTAALVVGVPLTLAWIVNRRLRRGGSAA